jgi:tetratricopeptide (TPR) repeat protein
MWIPSLLQDLERGPDLKEMGMKVDAEDIHSFREASITDAIVRFGGGCTASLISDKGLLLTNHHCGYGRIQEHSSPEHDLMENGFWASSLEDELKNPGLEVTRIEGIIEVTEEMLEGVSDTLSEAERQQKLDRNTQRILADSVPSDMDGGIRSFSHGNAFFLFLTRTYEDVRLVAAPPASIGKFGGDTDNWIWPRHTGDFSLFRIYTAPDGAPADPSEKNVPYEPEKVLPISLEGIGPGDPVMALGFPASTRQFLPPGYLRSLEERSFPARIRMRGAALERIEAAMERSDSLRRRYRKRQAGLSNAYKKWKGIVEGLGRIRAVERKRSEEERFLDSAKVVGDTQAIHTLRSLKEAYSAYVDPELGRHLFAELMFRGAHMPAYVGGLLEKVRAYEEAKESGTLDSLIRSIRERKDRFFEKRSPELDRKIFEAQLSIYRERCPSEILPGIFDHIDTNYSGGMSGYARKLYQGSAVLNPDGFEDTLERFREDGVEVFKDDPAFRFVRSLYRSYGYRIQGRYRSVKAQIDSLMRSHVVDRRKLMPGPHWYDANGTLRASFGQVKGSSPRDGMRYEYVTTLEGVMEKADSSERHFQVLDRLKELYRNQEYGRYGVRGHMPVCFTASLHTSGGNSGSPVLNEEGHLVGLNFDRSWESVMSDLMYDRERCRNISVDIRYVLFLIEKLGKTDRLIEEIEIVDIEQRLKEVRERIARDPGDRNARALEIQLLIEAGRKRKAEKRLETAWDTVPSMAEYRVALARTMDRKEGIDHLERLVWEYSDHYGTWCTLGELRAKEGQDQGAVKAYTKAIGKHPSKAKAYRRRAELYKKMGKEKKACADLDALSRIDPLAVPRDLEKECKEQ